MSDDFSWLVDDAADAKPVALEEPVRHAPVNSPVLMKSTAELPGPRREGVSGWLFGFVLFLALTFFVLWLSAIFPHVIPVPHPDVDPVDGAYVAIFYKADELGEYTESQRDAINSAAIASYMDEHATDWKKIPVGQTDELHNLPSVYAEMAQTHRAKLPWVVIRSGRKFSSEPVQDENQLLGLLKKNLQ